MPIVREIVRSCSNDHVALAAVDSIGGAFAARIEALAEREGVPTGAFASSLVTNFDQVAREKDWSALGRAAFASDQPVLAGLRHILQKQLRRRRPAAAAAVGAAPRSPDLRGCAAAC